MLLRKPQFWLVVIALLAVAVVFIAPSVDLQPTALRSWQAACAIFLAMAVGSRVLSGYFPLRTSRSAARVRSSSSLSDPSASPFSCVLLC